MAEQDPKPTEPRTFTQEEVNELMGKLRREVNGKYSDYDALKDKAAKYDEAQEAAKTELEKATERAAKAEAEAEKLRAARDRAELVAKVSASTGVPATLIQGTDEDSMTASANAIAEFAKAQHPNIPSDRGGAANSPKPMTKASIYAIEDPVARKKAIAEHMELFK